MQWRMLASVRVMLALLLAVGCSSAAPSSPTEPTITLSLSNATVRETARAFALATSEPLVITPDAERFADCVRLSLLVPGARPVSEVVTLLAGALSSEGFALARQPAGWTLSHEGGAPSACVAGLVGAVAPPPLGPPSAPSGPVTETRADIPRAEIDALFADQTALMRAARVIPHLEDGAVVGLRVYGIRRDSGLARLGFQNGDTVHTVNGRSIVDPERALEAYSELRGASEYRVELDRRGERVEHTIHVVD